MRVVNKKYLILFFIFVISLGMLSPAMAQDTLEPNRGEPHTNDYSVSYSRDGNTFIITNTREVAKVDITATKIWVFNREI